MRAITSAAFALLTIATLAACSQKRENGRIHASGHIEATEVRVSAKIGGRLAELLFQEGAPVRTGEVVARFETVDSEHELARVRGECAAAEARLALLEAGTRREDLDRIGAEVARIETELAAAGRDLDRLDGLATRGSATEKARDDAHTRRDVLLQALAAAKAEQARARSGARPQEIALARAQRDAARALVATAEQRLADTVVTAPRDGVVTHRATEPGEVLPPGSPLLVLSDLDHPWLSVWVDEPSLAQIRLGDAVAIHVDGRADTFEGSITHIASVAEFTPKNVQTPEQRAMLVFKVKIALDNPSGVFKPGMPADAFFSRSGMGKAGSPP